MLEAGLPWRRVRRGARAGVRGPGLAKEARVLSSKPGNPMTLAPNEMVVKLEVFDPNTQHTSLRIGIPVEALFAMAENGRGQIYVVDRKMTEVSGIGSLHIEPEHSLGKTLDPTGLEATK